MRFALCPLGLSPTRYTLRNLADHLEAISHDRINRYLRHEKLTSRFLWENVKPLIKELMQYIDKLGEYYYCPLNKNRLVDVQEVDKSINRLSASIREVNLCEQVNKLRQKLRKNLVFSHPSFPQL